MSVRIFANEAINSKVMDMVSRLVPNSAKKNAATAGVANDVEMEKIRAWLRRVGANRDVSPDTLQRTVSVAARERAAAAASAATEAMADREVGRLGRIGRWLGGYNGQDYVLSTAALRTGGVIAGAAGAYDIGSRIAGDGGVFHDNEGNFDIAGIPFI